MRYLKLFNESLLYKEIPMTEWHELYVGDMDAFRQKYNILKIDVEYPELKQQIRNKFKFRSITLISSGGGTTYHIDNFISIATLSDEWFLVEYKYLPHEFQFFKCDQIDGLMSLLSTILPTI